MGATCGAGGILAGLVAGADTPRMLPPGGLARLIPKQIGPWTLTRTDGVVKADEPGGRRGPYDDLSTRIYQADAFLPVTLLVAYVSSQRGDVRLHRPETCYPAAGFSLSKPEPVQLSFPDTPVVSAQMMYAESAMRDEWLLYWTRVGAAFPTSNVEQVEAAVRENLSGRVPDGVLVRLSVPGHDRRLAGTLFQIFLTALLNRQPELGNLLCGTRSGP
ncbi:exosortase C-terminal domain/associated protein EpsI [Sphingomonas montana]|uniref:exosortase C-terminal domain/associated protein EpsI n=1 Tax=Sphingomonas montana TaxID=1843236 RepID=UPI0023E37D92|nr:exosortase C-terminal domain/associated protein EpsI [Sphingomonas montana]